VLLLDKEGFETHLARHRQEILKAVNSLYKNLQSSPATNLDAQNALKSALAKNNALLADISRLNAEKDDKDDRLTDTMMRLLSLEKKLDRSKSLTLAKIEAQATQRASEESQEQEVQENGNTPSRPNSRVCPSSRATLMQQITNRNNAELESANAINRAALAAVKEECASLLREKSSLLQQLSQITMKVRLMINDLLTLRLQVLLETTLKKPKFTSLW
jgi:E3 ubiquitin-protein ligase BRE1